MKLTSGAILKNFCDPGIASLFWNNRRKNTYFDLPYWSILEQIVVQELSQSRNKSNIVSYP